MMKKKTIYSLRNLKVIENKKIQQNDILIVPESELTADLGCKTIAYNLQGGLSERELNNRLLLVADQLMRYIRKDQYCIKIVQGNFILNNYLTLIADVFQIELYINGQIVPSFNLSLDLEELKIYKRILREKIKIKEYKTLPPQWRSLYFEEESGLRFSGLGKALIEHYE